MYPQYWRHNRNPVNKNTKKTNDVDIEQAAAKTIIGPNTFEYWRFIQKRNLVKGLVMMI
jgi:hypothetical protein